jgi:hypothetical protein
MILGNCLVFEGSPGTSGCAWRHIGSFLEYDHGRRASTKKYYPEPHHPSVSLMDVRKDFGENERAKITNTDLNWLYSALIAKQPIDPTHLMINRLCCGNIEFGRYWFGVLPLHVGYLFETGYTRNPKHLLPGTSLGLNI